jgi:hypothetical protein
MGRVLVRAVGEERTGVRCVCLTPETREVQALTSVFVAGAGAPALSVEVELCL